MGNYVIYKSDTGLVTCHCTTPTEPIVEDGMEVLEIGDVLDTSAMYVVSSNVVTPIPKPDHPCMYWDGTAWVMPPTDPQQLDLDAREKRQTLLAESDWTDTLSAKTRLGDELYNAWQAYRQALRDITNQPDYPQTIDWPTPPA